MRSLMLALVFLAASGCGGDAPTVTLSEPASAASPNRAVIARRPAPVRPAPVAARDEASIAVLREALASKDYATRLLAVEALGDVHTEEFLPWLEHALGDPEHDVRMAAVDALAKYRTESAARVLRTVRGDKTEEMDIRALAASALLTRQAH